MANREVKYILAVDYSGEKATLKATQDIKGLDGAAKEASKGLKDLQQGLASEAVGRYNAKVAELSKQVMDGSKSFDQAERELKRFNERLGEGPTAVDKVKGAFDSLKGAILPVTVALAAVVVAGKAAWDALKEGAAIRQTEDSFKRLNNEVWKTPDLLAEMRKASRGTISDMQLMAGVLTLTAGASEDLSTAFAGAAPQLLEIAKAANKLNPSLGDTAFMYESITTGIKRSEIEILDNLGIVIKIDKAYKDYATSLGKAQDELTANERSMAVLNATLEAGDRLIGQVGGSVDSTTDSAQRFEATLKNIADDAKAAFSEEMAKHTDDLAAAAERAAPALAEMAVGLAQLISYADDLDKLIEFSRIMAGGPILGPIQQAIQKGTDFIIGGIKEKLDSPERIAQMAQANSDYIEGMISGYYHAADGTQQLTGATGELGEAIEEVKEQHRGYAREATSGTRDLGEAMSESRREMQEEQRAANKERLAQIEEEKLAFVEAVEAEADALRQMYDEAAARGGDAFIQQMQMPQAEQMFDPSGAANINAVRDAIIGAADAAGAGAPQLADLTSEMGLLSDEAAELKVKAAIFDEALGILTKEWKMGNIDTSTFLSSVDDVIRELETKSLPQLTMELKPPEIPSWDMWTIPGGSHGAMKQLQIEADIDPVRTAMREALELVGGAPLDERTLIVEFDGAAVDTGISVATALVGDFVAGEYVASVILNIDSVEEGAGRTNTLLADLPEFKSIRLDFTSNIDDIIRDLREAGVVQ